MLVVTKILISIVYLICNPIITAKISRRIFLAYGQKSCLFRMPVSYLLSCILQISFLASRGQSYEGSIAIDNIELLDGISCEYKPLIGKPLHHKSGD